MCQLLNKLQKHCLILALFFCVFVIPTLRAQTCPVINFIGDDFTWNSNLYGNGINIMTETTDGFLTMGRNNANDLFQSANGQNLTLDSQGAYLLKYSSENNLEWHVTIKYADGTQPTEIDPIDFAVEDNAGNIYLTGFSRGDFFDTMGNEVSLFNPSYSTNFQQKAGFVIKLNSEGELIWYMQTAYTYPQKLFIDNDNNLVTVNRNYEAFDHDIYLNGVYSETILKRDVDDYYGASILKFSPDGSLIWSNILDSWNSNGYIVENLDFDAQNNIYLIGSGTLWAKVYSAEDTEIKEQINRSSTQSNLSFLIKYNQNGQYLWNVKSEAQTPIPSSKIVFNDIITDELGNSYITGKNNRVTGTGTHFFQNTDGSTTTTAQGPYFISKIDNSGICKWVYGINSANGSEGHEVFLDNDEIYVVGEAFVNNQDTATPTFYSANDENLSFDVGRSDVFMAVYDPIGNLKRVVLNGGNGDFRELGFQGFFKSINDSFYLAINFDWYNGQENYAHFGNIINTINGAEGTVVKFTEDCGIVYSNTVVADIVIETTTNQISCNGSLDGTILINASGGEPPYTYELLNSEDILLAQSADNNFNNLGAGTYKVKVTDANGNFTQSNEIVLDEPAPVVIQVEQSGITCANTDSGSFVVTVSGGNAPYQYRLDNGDLTNTNIFAGLGLNTYTIWVVDANGCEYNQLVEMLENPPLLFDSIDTTLVSCTGSDDGTITINASGGQTPYEYSIDGTNYIDSNQIAGLSAGVYGVTIKDATGCISDILQVQVEEVVSPDFDNDGIGDDCDDDIDGDGVLNINDLCPNTPLGSFVGVDGCIVFSLPIDNFQILATGETCAGSMNGIVEVVAMEDYDYSGTLTGDAFSETKEFNANTVFTGLKPGNYELCITIADYSYQKCFDLIISGPEPLDVYAQLNSIDRIVSLELKGGVQYFVTVNDKVYTTNQNELLVPLDHKVNKISVTTDKNCQGSYEEIFLLDNEILAYPNPVEEGFLEVICETKEDSIIDILLFDALGRKADFKRKTFSSGHTGLILDGLPSGIYYLSIKTIKSTQTKQIIIK